MVLQVLVVVVVDHLVVSFWTATYLALSQDVLRHITVTQRQASEWVGLGFCFTGRWGHCRLGIAVYIFLCMTRSYPHSLLSNHLHGGRI